MLLILATGITSLSNAVCVRQKSRSSAANNLVKKDAHVTSHAVCKSKHNFALVSELTKVSHCVEFKMHAVMKKQKVTHELFRFGEHQEIESDMRCMPTYSEKRASVCLAKEERRNRINTNLDIMQHLRRRTHTKKVYPWEYWGCGVFIWLSAVLEFSHAFCFFCTHIRHHITRDHLWNAQCWVKLYIVLTAPVATDSSVNFFF